MKVISLFTGSGGLDIGFEAAGFDIQVAVEFAEYACNTLRLNRPNLKVMGPPDHSGDVSTITGSEILEYAGMKIGDVDMMVGGPPCQPFSMAAAQRFLRDDSKFKRTGYSDEKRGTLLLDYVRLIVELKPKAFLIENVPGIIDIDGGVQIKTIREELAAHGYKVADPYIVNMADLGIPQSRRRAIIVGNRLGVDFRFPTQTHGPSGLLYREYMSVAHALLSLDKATPNNDLRDHKEESVKRYEKLFFGQREKLGRVDRLDPFAPSKTIIAGGSNGGGRSHLHPFSPRTLSVRESARLQTYPDSYVFTGSIARQFTQVGNSVPPLFGEIIGRSVAEQLFGLSKRGKYRLSSYLDEKLSVKEAVKLLRNEHKDSRSYLYDSYSE